MFENLAEVKLKTLSVNRGINQRKSVRNHQFQAGQFRFRLEYWTCHESDLLEYVFEDEA